MSFGAFDLSDAVIPDALAAIDIGTNSVHMVVARASGNGRFEVLTKEKEMVRLGSGPSEMKKLTGKAIDRGVASLDRCRRIAANFDAEVRAVATSAVREATNQADFIERVKTEAGLDVEVISGFEEARLIHLGVLQALPVFDTPLLVCDIGGGSTELLHGLGEEIRAARSMKLGSIRLTEKFFPDGKFGKSGVKACRAHVRDRMAGVVREAGDIPIEVATGSSGTIEALFVMAQTAAGTKRPQVVNGGVLSRQSVADLVKILADAGDAEAIRSIPGSDPARADIVLAGALILEGVLDAFELDEITISEGALREGVLLDSYRRLAGSASHHLDDIRGQGVRHLMTMTEDDPDHAVQVAWLADRLFTELASELGVTDEYAELLEAAALLSNAGLWISHARHHQHSYYVIRNSEHLTGFTDREIELVAQVARYHRKSAPSMRHDAFAALAEADRDIVSSLASLVRVAIGLDRSHRELVQQIEVEILPESVAITIAGADPEVDLGLEVWSAGERAGLLETLLGRPVTFAKG
jgi:exopolyphosphatase/guanosine-5'-triphosphate,3'-diphosphate pyrophosphatase